MVKKLKKYVKFVVCCALMLSLMAPSYAALSASDGSAFVTKAEFDSALADFNARLTTFEAGINSKIDSQVTSYLDRNGIWSGKKQVYNEYTCKDATIWEIFDMDGSDSSARDGYQWNGAVSGTAKMSDPIAIIKPKTTPYYETIANEINKSGLCCVNYHGVDTFSNLQRCELYLPLYLPGWTSEWTWSDRITRNILRLPKNKTAYTDAEVLATDELLYMNRSEGNWHCWLNGSTGDYYSCYNYQNNELLLTKYFFVTSGDKLLHSVKIENNFYDPGNLNNTERVHHLCCRQNVKHSYNCMVFDKVQWLDVQVY